MLLGSEEWNARNRAFWAEQTPTIEQWMKDPLFARYAREDCERDHTLIANQKTEEGWLQVIRYARSFEHTCAIIDERRSEFRRPLEPAARQQEAYREKQQQNTKRPRGHFLDQSGNTQSVTIIIRELVAAAPAPSDAPDANRD